MHEASQATLGEDDQLGREVAGICSNFRRGTKRSRQLPRPQGDCRQNTAQPHTPRSF